MGDGVLTDGTGVVGVNVALAQRPHDLGHSLCISKGYLPKTCMDHVHGHATTHAYRYKCSCTIGSVEVRYCG